MFTIDLLKGQGVPSKGGPGGLVIMAMTAVVPIVAAMGMFVLYLNNDVTASVREKEIARLEAEIAKLSGDVKLYNTLEKEKAEYRKCLSEVKSSTDKHVQWSPVLTTLIEEMPDSVILTSLVIEHGSVKKMMPKKDKPKKKVEISVPVRILRLTVTGGNQSNSIQEVKDFMDRIRASASLGPKLENVVHSQTQVKVEGRQLLSHEISCVFKPEL